jgi:hypothetical protein
MSKELTPLEALERLGKLKVEGLRVIPKRATVSEYIYYEIIEKALKALEQMQIILGAEKIEDLPNLAIKIDNALYSTSYKLKQNEKKLKALKIIKKVIKYDIEVNGNTGIPKYEPNDVITQEEYDLLKEVLL